MGKKEKKHMHEKEEEVMTGDCCCHSDESECGCGDECCCGEEFTHPHLVRQFYTKAEKVEMLEEYLADLKAEMAAVEEEIAELKK